MRAVACLLGVLATLTAASGAGARPPILRAPPSFCAGSSATVVFSLVSPSYGRLVGAAPVWTGVYATYDAHANAFRLGTNTRRTAAGWAVKFLWVIAPDHVEPVTVSGSELRGSGISIRFRQGNTSGRVPPRSTTFDTRSPGSVTSEGTHKEFPSELYFPRAGCYELEARWRGGRWRVVFGIGR